MTRELQRKFVLFLHIKFEIHQKEISGYVALLMDIPSLDELRSLIAAFIGSITQNENTRSTTGKS
jgi:chemotaxis protein CheC